MRPSVCISCLLVLAICVAIVCHSRIGRASNNEGKLVPVATSPAADLEIKVATLAKVMPVSERAAPPSWELRLGEIAGEPESLQSQEELEELADDIPEGQVRAALDTLSTDPSSACIIVARRLVEHWANVSPDAAAQWVANLPDNNFSHVASGQLMVSWAQTNLEAALMWVQGQPDGGNKTAAELTLAHEAAAGKEPVKAIELIAGLAPSQERDDLLNYSVRQWANQDRDTAVQWINQIPDETLRGQLLENVALDWAVADPVDSAQFAATVLPSGSGQDKTVVSIVRFWAVCAPNQAAAWITQSLGGDLRNVALMNLIDVWRQNNPAGTDAWLRRLESAQ